jgi:hypothetical protein
LHHLSASFTLAYHGCDRKVGEELLRNRPFTPSENDYDWLGHGIYFWDTNPLRGLEWARELQRRRLGTNRTIQEPFVVGAVIDLGFCLDLASTNGIEMVKQAYDGFLQLCAQSGRTPPQNEGGQDLLLRRLDCAVINHIHRVNELTSQPVFDTVRGVFFEGSPIYLNSGFFEKTHIQICVRTPASIRAVFRVPEDQLS